MAFDLCSFLRLLFIRLAAEVESKTYSKACQLSGPVVLSRGPFAAVGELIWMDAK